MVDLDKQPVDTDSCQTSGLTPLFKESMNVHRVTGVRTAVILHQSFLVFTLVNNIVLQNKVYTEINLQLDKSSNEADK